MSAGPSESSDIGVNVVAFGILFDVDVCGGCWAVVVSEPVAVLVSAEVGIVGLILAVVEVVVVVLAPLLGGPQVP